MMSESNEKIIVTGSPKVVAADRRGLTPSMPLSDADAVDRRVADEDAAEDEAGECGRSGADL